MNERLESYIADHPTHFNWRDDVRNIVGLLREKWDAQTYVNTYFWHPPYDPPIITERYDSRSFDVWGPRFRGDPLDPDVGDRIYRWLVSDRSPGRIHWIIYKNRMHVYDYHGNTTFAGKAPWGPADSDARHDKHIHVTYH